MFHQFAIEYQYRSHSMCKIGHRLTFWIIWTLLSSMPWGMSTKHLVPPIFDAMHSNRVSNACKMMAGSEIEPLKCALRFKPPTLVLLYKSLETGRSVRKWALCDCTIDAKSIYCPLRFFFDPGKTRKRSIPIRGLTAETRWEEETERKLMWGLCVYQR